jgi:hypothetical protein
MAKLTLANRKVHMKRRPEKSTDIFFSPGTPKWRARARVPWLVREDAEWVTSVH